MTVVARDWGDHQEDLCRLVHSLRPGSKEGEGRMVGCLRVLKVPKSSLYLVDSLVTLSGDSYPYPLRPERFNPQVAGPLVHSSADSRLVHPRDPSLWSPFPTPSFVSSSTSIGAISGEVLLVAMVVVVDPARRRSNWPSPRSMSPPCNSSPPRT